MTNQENLISDDSSSKNQPDKPDLKNSLTSLHAFVLLTAVAIWGTNFVVMKNTVDVIPPLMLAALRFFFTFLPAAFFIKRPQVALSNLCGYGLSIGVLQFGFLYIAVNGHITPGLASLVVQSQAIFTIAISAYLNKESVRRYQIIALVMAILGLTVIGAHTDTSTTLLGLGLTLVAAMGWTCGNLLSKKAVGVDILSYVVWSALFSFPALLALSLCFEGINSFVDTIQNLNWQTWTGVLWQSWASTIFCFAIWGWLLARYTTATVSPFALLIPIFGMAASSIFLGEPLPLWKCVAALMVICAMLLNTFGPRLLFLWKKNHHKLFT